MGDGYWDKRSKTVFIYTDNFTFNEVLLLINVLENCRHFLQTKSNG